MKESNVDQVLMLKKRIEYLRETLEISKADMAEKLGISYEEYESYESGDNDIPISLIYSIASLLDVDPTEILVGESPKVGSYSIARKGTGVNIKRYEGYSFESLAYNYIGRNKEPMLVTIHPSDEPAELVSHSGQEFNYVVEGTVGVVIGKKVLVLNEGDSIYFDPTIPHGQMAIGDKPVKFLTVIDIE